MPYTKKIKSPVKISARVFQDELKEITKDAMGLLNRQGISDKIIVKYHRFIGYRQAWIACYRDKSQFSSFPIIWINEDIDELLQKWDVGLYMKYEVILDSIINEYGHVISEWCKYRNPNAYITIQSLFEDPEDFSESLVDYIKKDKRKQIFKKIIDEYKNKEG
jgi:hypothetical protein